MKKLLLTTILVAVGSTSFADPTTIRDRLRDIYSDYGHAADWNATDGDTNAASEYAELLHLIDNHQGETPFSPSMVNVDARTSIMVGNTEVNLLPSVSFVEGTDFSENMADIEAQVATFILALETETIANGGFIHDELVRIEGTLVQATADVLAASTVEEARGYYDTFITQYNADSAKFNNTVMSLASIATETSNISSGNIDVYTLNLQNKTEIVTHIDWVNGNYTEAPDNSLPNFNTPVGSIAGNIQTGWAGGIVVADGLPGYNAYLSSGIIVVTKNGATVGTAQWTNTQTAWVATISSDGTELVLPVADYESEPNHEQAVFAAMVHSIQNYNEG